MKKNVKKLFALGFIGLTALSASTIAVSAFGSQGLHFQNLNSQDSLQSAINTNDYTSFQKFFADGVSKEYFDQLVIQNQHHEAIETAIENADYDTFVASFDNTFQNIPSEEVFNDIVAQHLAHEKVEQAIEDKNYDMWLSAVSDLPHGEGMADIISEDEFDLYVEMHESMEAGEFETAQHIAEELGLENEPREGIGMMQGPKGLQEAGQGSRRGVGLGDGTGPKDGHGFRYQSDHSRGDNFGRGNFQR